MEKISTYNVEAIAEGHPEEACITANKQLLYSFVVHLGGSDPDEELYEIGDQN